jgi:hypothetical protein
VAVSSSTGQMLLFQIQCDDEGCTAFYILEVELSILLGEMASTRAAEVYTIAYDEKAYCRAW